jgi:hypothetical protein
MNLQKPLLCFLTIRVKEEEARAVREIVVLLSAVRSRSRLGHAKDSTGCKH